MLLHTVGDAIRAALQAVPMGAVRAVFVLLPLALLVWVVCLPSAAPRDRGGAVSAPWDLKWPAIVALGCQVVIYAVEWWTH